MRKLFNLPMWLVVVMGLGFVVLDDELGLVDLAKRFVVDIISSDERINFNPNAPANALNGVNSTNLDEVIDRLNQAQGAIQETQSWGEFATEVWNSIGSSSEATSKIDTIPTKLSSFTTLAYEEDVASIIGRYPSTTQNELVWFARGIYSETKRSREQYLVAWVIRNRVEANHRGKFTYRDILLDDKQFSAFNEENPNRRNIMGLFLNSSDREWKKALKIALKVFSAPVSERPFSADVKHFYSPIGLHGRKVPTWSVGKQPLSSNYLRIDPNRFLFYKGIDSSAITERPSQFPPDRGLVPNPRRRRLATPSGRIHRPTRPSNSSW